MQQRSEEDFKLPLRLWIIKQLDKRACKGVEWIDKNAQKFKIPWTQKGHPNWEDDCEIFRAWAKHRGSYSSPPDDSKYKSNFRCVLAKSDDFRELKEESKTGLQTGNYKVFQILLSGEVKAIVDERNRKRSADQSVATTSASSPRAKRKTCKDANVCEAAGPSTTTFDLVPPGESQLSVSPPRPVTFLELDGSTLQSDGVEENYDINSFPPLTSCFPLENSNVPTIMPPVSVEEVTKILEDEGGNLSIPIITDPDQFITEEIVEYSDISSQVVPQKNEKEILQEILKKSNTPESLMTQYKVTVRYGEDIIVSQSRLDFLNGIRVLYGDPEQQKLAIKATLVTADDDFNLETWPLPRYEKGNVTILDGLEAADQGIVFKAGIDGNLYGKRLCQSRVWLADGPCFEKLGRYQTKLLFSYSDYVKNLAKNESDKPRPDIQLFIGKSPKKPRSKTIGLTLEPVLVPILDKNLTYDSFSSYCSSEASIDRIIRSFQLLET